MGKVTPLVKNKIVKKRTKSFERHQYQQFKRIGRSSWRKSHGLDSRVTRRFKVRMRLTILFMWRLNDCIFYVFIDAHEFYVSIPVCMYPRFIFMSFLGDNSATNCQGFL